MSEKQQLHYPDNDTKEKATLASRKLSKLTGEKKGEEFFIVKGNETILVPKQAIESFLEILSGMADGKAVSVKTRGDILSTQQAADILNVSRPYLVKLLDNKIIPSHKVGVKRRVMASDLFEYKDKLYKEGSKQLDEIVEELEDLGLEY